MAWATTSTVPAWNVTDKYLLQLIQYALLENGNADADGATLITSQFTLQEWIDTLQWRTQKFLRDTGCVLTQATEASVPGTSRYTLPSDWIFTRSLCWQPVGGTIKALVRTDAFALDHGMNDWEQNTDTPVAYNDGSDLPTLTVEIAKAPSNVGQMLLDYVSQPPTLTGAGVSLNIPDEMAEASILWGTMGDLLSSEGEAQDYERAAYCEFRYNLGVELTRRLMTGGANG